MKVAVLTKFPRNFREWVKENDMPGVEYIRVSRKEDAMGHEFNRVVLFGGEEYLLDFVKDRIR